MRRYHASQDLFFAHADHLIFDARSNFGALKATGADERCDQKNI
jgi:hypothetical protein